jgi:glucose-6-phosphate dehydrogenase assembly protein OpcA
MATTINSMNACLFNLIIYTNNTKRAEYFHEIVNALINKFPCRVIFIELDDGEMKRPPDIARVNGGQQCDQIRINAAKDNIEQVPYTLLSNLVPDLPVYLIWGENPATKNPLLPELMKLATRIIYDSECTSNLKQFCQDILTNLLNQNIDFMDIDWALIRGWREVIAKTFDNPEKLEMLNRSKTLQIFYNEIPSVFINHFSTRAYYLQGWLAGQLGWKFSKQTPENILTYNIDKTEINVEFKIEQNSNLAPGTISKVIFKTSQSEEIVISKIQDQSMVLVHITRGDNCELPFSFRLPDFERGLSFIKEIFYYRTSEQYKKMLEVLQQIDWKF